MSGTAIDLSGLGLDTIEETDVGFSIGAMVTLRQLETHPGLEAFIPRSRPGSAAPHRGRAAAQPDHRRRQHLQPVWLFWMC